MLRALFAALFVLSPICSANAQEIAEASASSSSADFADTAVYSPAITPTSREFNWKGAATDSMRMLLFQNGLRFATEAKTRQGLTGPYMKDYIQTLHEPPRGFLDGDSVTTNFILHPIQGSTSYHIARNHGATRTQAFWWGVAYSTHFELSPLGEAGFGNVRVSPVDLIVTPSAGFLLGTTEEWLLGKLSGKTGFAAKVARFALAGRTLSQFAAMKRY
jgi:hypothetical protein